MSGLSVRSFVSSSTCFVKLALDGANVLVNEVESCALLLCSRNASVFRFLVCKLHSLADTRNFLFRSAYVFSVVKHDFFQV